jgi:hypothetical protein
MGAYSSLDALRFGNIPQSSASIIKYFIGFYMMMAATADVALRNPLRFPGAGSPAGSARPRRVAAAGRHHPCRAVRTAADGLRTASPSAKAVIVSMRWTAADEADGTFSYRVISGVDRGNAGVGAAVIAGARGGAGAPGAGGRARSRSSRPAPIEPAGNPGRVRRSRLHKEGACPHQRAALASPPLLCRC